MIGTTGTTCERSGIYESIDGCRTRLTFRVGDMFSDCPRCARSVSWRLITPI